ncbi:hypothetical protein WJX77_000512 [Trebouxia sp. C0004]
MAEFVEVPDVLPAVTLISPPVKAEVPRTAIPLEAPLEVSQAAPSVTNAGFAMEVLGPNLTMTTPMDASDTQASAPSEPHIVQAACTHVRPLAGMSASTGTPSADAAEPLLTITSVTPAVEEGSPLTLEPCPVSETGLLRKGGGHQHGQALLTPLGLHANTSPTKLLRDSY